MNNQQIYNMQFNDINNRLLSIDKKIIKIMNNLDYLTNKINEIHDEIFLVSPSNSPLSPYNTSPITIRKKSYKKKDFDNDLINLKTLPPCIADKNIPELPPLKTNKHTNISSNPKANRRLSSI